MIDIIISIIGTIVLLMPIIVGSTYILLYIFDYNSKPVWWHYVISPIALLIMCALMPLIMFCVGMAVLEGVR